MLCEKLKRLEDDRSLAHSWIKNRSRLDVLAQIRQNSLRKAEERGCRYYFVADCDNLILPHTLRDMVACQKPIVAPLLHCVGNENLSNFVMAALKTPASNAMQERKIRMKERGIFPAMLVHNTYLVDVRYASKLSYEGRDGSFEFTNFSISAKKNGVNQYVCNKRFYGFFLHFWNTVENEARLIRDHGPVLQDILDAMIDEEVETVYSLLNRVSVSNVGWMKRADPKEMLISTLV